MRARHLLLPVTSSTLFLSFALGAPAPQAISGSSVDSKSDDNDDKPPTTGFDTKPLERDKATLAAFAAKVATNNGDPQNSLATWRTDPDIHNWRGVQSLIIKRGNYECVVGVELNGFGLTGPHLELVGWLDKMVDLGYFHATDNAFGGPIPDLSPLQYLFELQVANNQLTGAFPAGVTGEKTVVEGSMLLIDVSHNKLEGGLPDDLLALAVEQVDVSDNAFTGELPSKLRKDAPLQFFDASNNRLEGKVPDDLCAAPKLTALNLKGNRLSGELGPNCLALLQKGLLDVSDNCLSNAERQREKCDTKKDGGESTGLASTVAGQGAKNGKPQ